MRKIKFIILILLSIGFTSCNFNGNTDGKIETISEVYIEQIDDNDQFLLSEEGNQLGELYEIDNGISATIPDIAVSYDMNNSDVINLNSINCFNSYEHVSEIMYELSIEDDASMYDHCVINDHIYYVVDLCNMGNFSRHVQIRSFNTNDETTCTIYNYETIDIGKNIVELVSYKNNIIWLEMIESMDIVWEIHMMNLTEKQDVILLTSSDFQTDLYPMLEVKGDYLFWYTGNDGVVGLVKMDLKTRDIVNVKNNLYIRTPYSHLSPYCEDVICVMYVDQEGESIIIEYSTKETEVTIDTCLDCVSHLIANYQYIIWGDEYNDTIVHILDLNSGEVYLYDTSANDEHIHQIGFIGNYIFIEYLRDIDGNNNLYLLDLPNNSMYKITNNDESIVEITIKNIANNKLSADRSSRFNFGVVIFEFNF